MGFIVWLCICFTSCLFGALVDLLEFFLEDGDGSPHTKTLV